MLVLVGSWLPRSASAASHRRCSSDLAGFAACIRGRPAANHPSSAALGGDDRAKPSG